MKKALLSLLFCLMSVGSVNAQAPYFQAKTITIIVGYQAGDGYDIWARLLAAHMGKHIPGSPGMIVQNMPGAGSMIAANYLYNVAKPDGFTQGSIGPSLYIDQLVGKKEVQFDWAKFGWVGSTENTPWLLYMKTDTPYKTIEDVRKASQPPKCSATGTGTSGHFIPKLLEEAVGAKFTVVMGYQGGAEQDLAFERGEVVCRSLSIPTFFAREPFMTWRKKNMVSTPPGLPADRLKTLREGFQKTMADPAFLADVKARKLEADPDFGEQLEAIAKEAVNQPREVVEKMKKLLGD